MARKKAVVQEVRLRPLAGMSRSFGIIRREARPLSHAARALVEFLRDPKQRGNTR